MLQDSKHARELAKVMREADQIVPPELESMQGFGGGGGYGGGGGMRYRSGMHISGNNAYHVCAACVSCCAGLEASAFCALTAPSWLIACLPN